MTFFYKKPNYDVTSFLGIDFDSYDGLNYRY